MTPMAPGRVCDHPANARWYGAAVDSTSGLSPPSPPPPPSPASPHGTGVPSPLTANSLPCGAVTTGECTTPPPPLTPAPLSSGCNTVPVADNRGWCAADDAATGENSPLKRGPPTDLPLGRRLRDPPPPPPPCVSSPQLSLLPNAPSPCGDRGLGMTVSRCTADDDRRGLRAARGVAVVSSVSASSGSCTTTRTSCSTMRVPLSDSGG